MIRVAILGTIIGGESIDGASLTDVIAEQAELAIGSTLVPALEIHESGLEEALRGCGSNVGCISERLGGAGVDRLIEVVVNLELTPELLTLRMIDAGVQRAVASQIIDVDGNVAASLRRGVLGLLEASGEVIGGRVAVDAEPSDAQIVLIPYARPHSSIPGVFIAAPGPYLVTATKSGYSEASSRTSIQREATAHVRFELEEESNLAASPWLWAGVGTVVTAIAVGVTLGVLLKREPEVVSICIAKKAPECM